MKVSKFIEQLENLLLSQMRYKELQQLEELLFARNEL